MMEHELLLFLLTSELYDAVFFLHFHGPYLPVLLVYFSI